MKTPWIICGIGLLALGGPAAAAPAPRSAPSHAIEQDAQAPLAPTAPGLNRIDAAGRVSRTDDIQAPRAPETLEQGRLAMAGHSHP
jgi:hypothetical protein